MNKRKAVYEGIDKEEIASEKLRGNNVRGRLLVDEHLPRLPSGNVIISAEGKDLLYKNGYDADKEAEVRKHIIHGRIFKRNGPISLCLLQTFSRSIHPSQTLCKLTRLTHPHSFSLSLIHTQILSICNMQELRALDAAMHQVATVTDFNPIDVDGYLWYTYEEIIINSCIDSARQRNEEESRECSRRWMAHNWASSRQNFLESLGHKSQALTQTGTVHYPSSSSSSSSSSSGAFAAAGMMRKGVGGRGGESIPQTPAELRSLFDVPNFRPPETPDVRFKSPLLSGVTDRETQGLSDLLQRHAKEFRTLHLKHRATSLSGHELKPADTLARCINEKYTTDGLTTEDLVLYKGLLEILADMCGETRQRAYPPGYFARICFDKFDEPNKDLLVNRHRLLTIGALNSLGNRYFDTIERALEEAMVTYKLKLKPAKDGHSQHRTIREYSKTRLEREFSINGGTIHPHLLRSRDNVPVWECVYNCIQSGRFEEAVAELRGETPSDTRAIPYPEESVPKVVIDTLVSFGKIWEDLKSSDNLKHSENLGQLHANLRATRDYYHRYQADDQIDPFKGCVLNLISLTDRDDIPLLPNEYRLLEHFEWSRLWFAEMSRALNLPNSDWGEDELFDYVMQCGGADYFDVDRAEPLKYALLLFTCHRFGDAIDYLWRANKSFIATHLLILCLHYGLILPHQPLTHNPPYSGTTSGLIRSRFVSSVNTDLKPARILQIYLQDSYISYPRLCADYFISLNSKWRDHMEGFPHNLVEKHSIESDDTLFSTLELLLSSLDDNGLKLLVGEPFKPGQRTGSRTEGRLDDYLDREVVNNLLAKVGHEMNERHRPEIAINMFFLAGVDCYKQIIHIFCRALASVALQPVDDNVRNHWINQAGQFFENYLTKGFGGPYLEDEPGLINSMRHLLDICTFFNLCAQYRCEEAIQMIDNLNIFPIDKSDYSQYIAKFTDPTVHPSLRDILDDVMLYYMECVCMCYRNIKMELSRLGTAHAGGMQVQTQAYMQEQLGRLEKRADAMANFAAHISSISHLRRVDTHSRIVKMRVELA